MKYFTIGSVMALLTACNGGDKNVSDKVSNTDSSNQQKQSGDTTVSKNQFKLMGFDKANTPLKDSLKGTIADGADWVDAEGEHTVVLVQTDNKMVNDMQSQRIYAYCFKKEAGAWKPTWQVKDGISDCEVDATCMIFPGSLSVSDADSNGVAEVSFLYHLSCKGDVSPDEKKLIMYEGLNKYAIRGSTIIQFPNGREGGQKNIDPSFTKAPRALLDHANKRWEMFGLMKY